MPDKPKRGRPFVPGDPRAGRPKGAVNKITSEVREVAQSLVNDSVYREKLAARLREGKAPLIEQMLWHYAYGKPTETVDLGPRAADTLTELVRKVAADGSDE